MIAAQIPFQRYICENDLFVLKSSAVDYNRISGLCFSFFSNIVEFWQCVATQADLSGFMIDHFLGILSSSCLYEVSGEKTGPGYQNVATHQPFAIFCALKEIVQGKNIQPVSCLSSHLFNFLFIGI